MRAPFEKFRLHNNANIRQQHRQCLDCCRSVKTYKLSSSWLTAVPCVLSVLSGWVTYLDCASSLNSIRVLCRLCCRYDLSTINHNGHQDPVPSSCCCELNTKIDLHFLASHHRKQRAIVRGQRLLPCSPLYMCMCELCVPIQWPPCASYVSQPQQPIEEQQFVNYSNKKIENLFACCVCAFVRLEVNIETL